MHRFVLVLVAAFSLAGCFKHQYTAPAATAQQEAAYDSWHHHFLFGLVNASGQVNLDMVCPTGVARIENQMSFLNGLVTVFTGSLYQPTTVRVYCRSSSQAHDVTIRPDADVVSRWQRAYPNLEADLERARLAVEAEEAAAIAGRSSGRF